MQYVAAIYSCVLYVASECCVDWRINRSYYKVNWKFSLPLVKSMTHWLSSWVHWQNDGIKQISSTNQTKVSDNERRQNLVNEMIRQNSGTIPCAIETHDKTFVVSSVCRITRSNCVVDFYSSRRHKCPPSGHAQQCLEKKILRGCLHVDNSQHSCRVTEHSKVYIFMRQVLSTFCLDITFKSVVKR